MRPRRSSAARIALASSLVLTFTRDEIASAHSSVDGWLLSHVASFAPAAENDGSRFDLRAKALAEICLYLHIAGPAGPLRSAMTEAIRDIVLEGEFLAILLSSPANTVKYAGCLLPFADDPRSQAIGRHYRDVCGPLRNELLPFQVLSHTYSLQALGLLDGTAARIEKQALAASAWRHAPTSLSPTEDGVYAFTHSALYASRFGRRRLRPRRETDDGARAYIDAELCRAFATRNLDAALEVIMARLALFGRITPQDAVAIESALSLLASKGYVLSPSGEEARPFQADHPEALWAASYHTMIVLGLLLVMLGEAGPRAQRGLVASGPSLEDLALGMDAVGTLYAGIDSGNLAVVVYVLSKLAEIPPELRPAETLLAPVRAYVAAAAALRAELGPVTTELYGMSGADFAEVMATFARCGLKVP